MGMSQRRAQRRTVGVKAKSDPLCPTISESRRLTAICNKLERRLMKKQVKITKIKKGV